MTGPVEQRLDKIAERMGWRLRWKAKPLPYTPALTMTELDIFAGKRLVTRDGPIWVSTIGKGNPREIIARRVIEYLRQSRARAA